MKSEDEIIKELKILIGLEEFNKLSYKENKAIKSLLDLYQKEKEKNKELDKKFKYAVPDEIVAENYIHKDKIREILDDEREKAKERYSNRDIGISIYKRQVQINMIDTIKNKLLKE